MEKLTTGLQHPLLRWLFWGLLIPIAGLNLWVIAKLVAFLQPLVTILTFALVLAFLLNHLVRWAQQHGLPRGIAVAIILLLVSGAIVGVSITLVPRAIEELGQLAMTIPTWLEAINQQLGKMQNWANNRHLPINFGRLSVQLSNTLPRQLQAITDTLMSLVTNTLGKVSTILLTLVATFYLLLDAERLWQGLIQRFPSPVAHRVFKSLRKNFRNYFMGQSAIAALTGALVTIIFLVLQVPFAILFGIAVGILAFVPFGDTLGIILFSIFVATQDIGLGLRMLIGAIVVEQIVDQVVAPRVMGQVTGLRPIWVFIALLLGVKAFGLVGVILAIPTAGFLKDMAGGFLELETTSSGLNPAVQDSLEPSASV